MSAVYIVGAARTPVAKANTAISSLSAVDLGACAIREAVARSGIAPDLINHVYMGQVLQAGVGQSPAKLAAIRAGLPSSVEATTINKVCASGLKAVSLATQEIMLGQASVQVAGGMESMSKVPMYRHRNDHGETFTDGLVDGLRNPYDGHLMGHLADGFASRYHISREDQDEYAAATLQRAALASTSDEIAPIALADGTCISADIMKRPMTFTELSAVPPAFSSTGTATAGNASYLADGASAVILADAPTTREHCANRKDMNTLARIISFADAAENPEDFAAAPAKAIQRALDQANLTVDQVSLWEINEAFAVVVLVSQEILGLDPSKVNINGGAIALGHPLGSSGCRILVSLLSQLRSGELGVAAICNGGGGSTAMIVQKVDARNLDNNLNLQLGIGD